MSAKIRKKLIILLKETISVRNGRILILVIYRIMHQCSKENYIIFSMKIFLP